MNLKTIIFILICFIGGALIASAVFFNINKQTMNTWEGYEKEWKKTDSLESAGLPKSALEVVEIILQYAESEKNAPQTIKAITYKSKYLIQTEADGDVLAIKLFEEKMNSASGFTKSILQSMLGEMYWNYYSANRWKFRDRTQTTGFDNEDIHTWDIAALHSKSQQLYTASVEDKEMLKKVGIQQFSDILISGDEFGRLMRPTLFDFLAHRAIDFLSNDEIYVSDVAYKFEITDPVIFENNKNFAGFVFSSEDTASKKLLALRLMQDLTTMHLYDPFPAALIDIDIKRLIFGKNNAIIPNKDSLYLNALLEEEKRYANDSSSARISYLIALYHQTKASSYDRLAGDEFKWERKTALEICEATIKKYPNSLGGKNCLALKETILVQDMDIAIEKINVPELPFRASVAFKNVDEIHLRILKLSAENMADLNQLNYDERFEFLKQFPVVRSWAQNLPDDGDHNEHVTEIKIDALPIGSYVLQTSIDKSFDQDKNKIIISHVWISNLAYIGNSDYNGAEREFYVVDRTSGEPIKDATIKTYRREYNYEKRKHTYKEQSTITTDANGYFSVRDPFLKDSYYFSFSISKGNDFLDVGNSYYIYKNRESAKNPNTQTYFFTDRSIYRPGQTIYFKGIMVEHSHDGKSKNIIPNKKTTITYYDVNSQKVASLDLVTNDYGSFSGSFTAPQGVLTGSMRLQNESGSADFSVEEYKRPTFSVEFEPLQGSFVLGDSVKISGSAMAYSGAVIDNANVQYRVVRNASFPYWYDYGWWRKPYPLIPPMEIANGVVKTDGEGKFEIDFTAIPDLSLNKEQKPQFLYTVFADVTDVSGETRSSESYVSVGYTNLNLYTEMKPIYYIGESATIKIITSNLNGTPEPAAGKMIIYPLQTPDKLLRGRTWQQPDKHIYSKDEYVKLFPHDLYADENNKFAWPVLNKITEMSWNTKNSDSLVIDISMYKPGNYKMELIGLDKNGEEIKVNKYFSVLRKGDFTIEKKYILTTTTDVSAKPGETAIINFGSSAKNVHALIEIKKGDGSTTRKWMTLPTQMNKGDVASMIDLEIPITESDRGGVNVQVYFIKDGRYFSTSYQIRVPWDNKNLKMELETHRDKLQPGAKETWKLKISGNNGEKVAAELLASMYDASLDAFKGHYWNFVSWPTNYRYSYWNADESFGNAKDHYWSNRNWNTISEYKHFQYDVLNWFGLSIGSVGYYMDAVQVGSASDYLIINGNNKEGDRNRYLKNVAMQEKMEEESITSESIGFDGDFSDVPVRKNLQETAFFYPQLETDADGNIIFSFTMPEALTKWNFKGIAHTKDLQNNQIFSSLVTQKELMIQPNMPRFLREGDVLEFTAKISNLTDSTMRGVAQLELFNALTMQAIDQDFSNTVNEIQFSANAKGSAVATWKLKIPAGYDAIVYRVKAKSGNFTDGEENAVPVLSNKILVTESLPLWVRGNKTTNFDFARLINSGNSPTLRNQSVTLEYTSNPAWYAVQALPYLMEYPYECSEQVFSRYYANSIASFIANSDPEIKRIFDSWKNDADALTSNLEKNQELKALLLEETPWVLQAQNETERKKRVALLFDLNRMQNEMVSSLNKLEKMQLPNGGWPWFKGSEDNRYITQYIVTGLAHLQQLGVEDPATKNKINNMLERAIQYCDARIKEDYRELIKNKTNMSDYMPGNLSVQYWYARSYFQQYDMDEEMKELKEYYSGQFIKYWTKYGLFEKGMLALILLRYDEKTIALNITKSLKEFSTNSDEMGMYWKDNTAGYYWYQAPIETQALMIEVFAEVAEDNKSVEDMKVWLLRQKQTTDWKTTKATAEACYALLMRGANLLSNKEMAIITVGDILVQPDKVEAGTGYFKTNWLGETIDPDFGKIKITPSSTNQLSYGAMYWQYFEDIDKVTSSNNQLQLTKKLFLQKIAATGPVLSPIDENTALKVGDLVKVRIEIRVDRDMEYVHMKDMRASCFEPVNVLSQYKWQDGLGYYEATGDASTNFFISYLRKGTYVFEYPIRVTHKGDFSNGITTIQCMYAPEFTSHSEGIRVNVR